MGIICSKKNNVVNVSKQYETTNSHIIVKNKIEEMNVKLKEIENIIEDISDGFYEDV